MPFSMNGTSAATSCCATATNMRREAVDIMAPVVRRHLHADARRTLRAGSSSPAWPSLEIRGRGADRQSAQARRCRQAPAARYRGDAARAAPVGAAAAGRGVAADAGVDDRDAAAARAPAAVQAARPSRCPLPTRTRPTGCRRRPATCGARAGAGRQRPARASPQAARWRRWPRLQCASQRRRAPRDHHGESCVHPCLHPSSPSSA